MMFISEAWAQDTAAAAGGGIGGAIFGVMPMVLIFGIFYFLLIRPQQLEAKKLAQMVAALKRGDTVITTGGVWGKVTALDTDTLNVEIADGVVVKVSRTAVQRVASEEEAKSTVRPAATVKKR